MTTEPLKSFFTDIAKDIVATAAQLFSVDDREHTANIAKKIEGVLDYTRTTGREAASLIAGDLAMGFAMINKNLDSKEVDELTGILAADVENYLRTAEKAVMETRGVKQADFNNPCFTNPQF